MERIETMVMNKTENEIRTKCEKLAFGEITEWAESLGWKDPDHLTDGKWTPEDCDGTEESAIDFIVAHAAAKQT
tara:strand:- start:14 stop:235 length:222 start_codon:yes stop_codon:yes gene_type:complete